MLPRIVLIAAVLTLLGGAAVGVVRLMAGRQPLPQAVALLAAGDLRGAQRLLRPLVLAEPRNAEAHVLLGRSQLDLHDPVAAEKEFRIARALRYEPMVVTPLLARAYLMQGHYQEVLAEVPATGATDEERVTNLGWRLAASLAGGALGQAEAILDTASAILPGHPLLALPRARVAAARGQVAEALTAVDAALAYAPRDVDAMLLKSELLLRSGQKAATLAVLDQAVAAEPSNVEVRLQRAYQYIAANEDKKAREDVDAALLVDQHDTPLLQCHALLLIREGRTGDAATVLQRVQGGFDRYPMGYYYLALAASLQQHNDSAADMLGRYLRLRPGSLDGLRLQGLVEQRRGRPALAAESLRRVVAATPEDAGAQDLLGRALFMAGSTTEALEAYRRATALDPANTEFAAHLAAALVSLGGAPTR